MPSESLFADMLEFRKAMKAEDFAEVHAPLDEKVQYTHSHKDMKKKGGHPPKDYQLVDTFIDFCKAFDGGDVQEALTLYLYLKRMLNY